jgi:hypothetical protein
MDGNCASVTGFVEVKAFAVAKAFVPAPIGSKFVASSAAPFASVKLPVKLPDRLTFVPVAFEMLVEMPPPIGAYRKSDACTVLAAPEPE